MVNLDPNSISELAKSPMLLVPIFLGVFNEALKSVFSLESKWCVVINWFGGALLYLMFSNPKNVHEAVISLILGFLAGNSAGGAYSGIKKVTETRWMK